VKTLVVSCHPSEESFHAHLRGAALEALRGAGEARHIDVYRTGPDDAALLEWAEAIVFIYPTWWSTLPAPFLAWLASVWGDRRFDNIRSITAVTTHGSGRWVNRLEGSVGRRMLERGLARRCSKDCRIRWVALYGIDRGSGIRRNRFVNRVVRSMNRLARSPVSGGR
jgi:putative NADPH-quinone reductase